MADIAPVIRLHLADHFTLLSHHKPHTQRIKLPNGGLDGRVWSGQIDNSLNGDHTTNDVYGTGIQLINDGTVPVATTTDCPTSWCHLHIQVLGAHRLLIPSQQTR